MSKTYSHFDPIEDGLDLLQVRSDPAEQVPLRNSFLVQDALVDLRVEPDQLDVGGDARVDLLIVQLDCRVDRRCRVA